MASKPSQSKRSSSLKTPFGDDVLVITRFEGAEGISEQFEFTIEAISERGDLDFDQAIGRTLTVEIDPIDGDARRFNGILVEVRRAGRYQGLYSYRLSLRPWLWLLSNTTDCRIFSSKTPIDIIRQVFQDNGWSDFREALSDNYPTLEYCVQYRESDRDFVCRLMEEFGVYYFFEHSRDKHTLVMADSRSAHKATPGLANLPYLPLDGESRRDRDHVTEWYSERRFRSGGVTFNSYDYLNPGGSLLSKAENRPPHQRGDLEIYDFQPRYVERREGERLAKVRLEAEQCADDRRHGSGSAVGLFPGGLTTLGGHPAHGENIQYLVVRCLHSYAEEYYRSQSEAGGGEPYHGAYEFLPATRQFRAPFRTARPLVHGAQTAKVVGRSGEEIDVDDHGRIRVEFQWDREHKPSRRVRVAQTWSGRQWGSVVIPRIGQEVVVEFLEGDPDQPIVVGAVYNGENKPPFDLPNEKSVSGVKSESTKGGGGFNQLTFDDAKASEKLSLRAEKDLDILVRSRETHNVGDAFTTAKGSPSRATTLKAGDDVLTVETGDRRTKVSAASDFLEAAQNIEAKAGVKIELKVGGSKITIEAGSITLESLRIVLKGAAGIEATAPKTEVTGSGVLILSGGMIKIN